jgi:CRISPR/Cas system-associated endonuclease Cas1
MHTDRRYRSSLASDLMEPARPAVDELVLSLLEDRHLARGDVIETREGVCRVGLPLSRELAQWGPQLRSAVAPHAELLARTLLRAPDHPTPLTRSRRLAALSR